MNVLGIVGSTRKSGNTATLMKAALSSIDTYGIDTDIVYLSDYNYKGCIGCEGCLKTYKCVIKDDMQKLYPKIESASAVILGSPTYFYNITAMMKAFIERLYCYEIFHETDRSVWMPIFESTGLKYAGILAICEQNNTQDMGLTAKAMQMPLEALGFRVVDTLKALHLFDKSDAAGNNMVLNQATALGEKLAKTLLLRQQVDKQV